MEEKKLYWDHRQSCRPQRLFSPASAEPPVRDLLSDYGIDARATEGIDGEQDGVEGEVQASQLIQKQLMSFRRCSNRR